MTDLTDTERLARDLREDPHSLGVYSEVPAPPAAIYTDLALRRAALRRQLIERRAAYRAICNQLEDLIGEECSLTEQMLELHRRYGVGAP